MQLLDKLSAVSSMVFCLVLGSILFLSPVTSIAQERSERSSERGDSEDRRSRWGWSSRSGEESSDRRDGRSESSGRSRSSSDSNSSESRAFSRRSDDSASIDESAYVKGLVKQFDKNGNMMLEGDELKALRPPASLADANNDKVITIDELIARLSSAAPSSTNKTAASSKTVEGKSSDESRDREEPRDSRSDRNDRGSFFRFGGGDRDRSNDRDERPANATGAARSQRVLTWMGSDKEGEKNSERHTYRFTPAAERLPNGLPSWFKSQDKNGDGQIAMSEYSRSWSRSTVSRFESYDLNGDGIITAKEALKRDER